MEDSHYQTKADSCINYLGKSSDEITGQLIGLAQSYLEKTESPGKLRKRVPFLIAESYQNIIRHGDHENSSSSESLDKDFFQINFFENAVVLCAVNKILKSQVPLLDGKIESLNKLNKDELKVLWRDSFSEGQLSDKGGAGLGLIEMARKSDMPIQKYFLDLDGEFSLFFTSLEIGNSPDSSLPKLDINATVRHYRALIETGVVLEYDGPFNNNTIVPLIEMMEENFSQTTETNSNALENLSMIIEIIQNASKHGLELNGIKRGSFTIFNQADVTFIRCGNLISIEEHAELSQVLKDTKSKTMNELKSDRDNQLLNAALSSDGNGNLGILEIALFTNNEFVYSFQKMPNKKHYHYSMTIKLKKNG